MLEISLVLAPGICSCMPSRLRDAAPHIAEICELGIILSLLLFLLSISTHTSLIFPSSISTFSSLLFRVTLSQRFSVDAHVSPIHWNHYRSVS